MKKILFLGDLVGAPGRELLYKKAQSLKAELEADFLIVNGENAAAGSGINERIVHEMLKSGVDAVTLGDHTWDQKGFATDLPRLENICRPANYYDGVPGADHLILEAPDGFRLLVFTVLGQTFMRGKTNCPFAAADAMLEKLAGSYDAAFVEVHGEVTSEKIAMGWHLDGRAAAVVGTHTHVATADNRVLPAGTAYQTDAGMCGAHDGVIGRDKEAVIHAFLDGLPRRFEIATGDVRLCGSLITYDETQSRAVAIERIEVFSDEMTKLKRI